MATITYKCPNCGGGMIFDPASQKFKCEFCLSEYTQAQLDSLQKAGASDQVFEEASPAEDAWTAESTENYSEENKEQSASAGKKTVVRQCRLVPDLRRNRLCHLWPPFH